MLALTPSVKGAELQRFLKSPKGSVLYATPSYKEQIKQTLTLEDGKP